ncbi:MAG TPA: segregation/condensation protein A [Candidatus Hydrogenedens sp.]|nr:segregation/condensation protein A [Candidatus Hydrogenedens sp.]HOL20654.1 segregation/condensation protein A [Candidatus Hydrogenedens sp.]HPP58466.1 segregation/condensation protein A [Candidatus Hydrogenedens sp.]
MDIQEKISGLISKDSLRLKLEQFEGPFEILLYLIKEQEIDIFDIPIVQITEQYLEILDLMKEQRLEIAGDFLVMAATLIHIKSRMLLPDIEEMEEVEEEDPRLELVEHLLEYRKFKELGKRLGDLEEQQYNYLPRKFPSYLEPLVQEEWVEVTLADLMKSIKRVLHYLLEPTIQAIELEKYTVEDKIVEIWDKITNQGSVISSELFKKCETTIEKVCIVLAILELCRQCKILIHQQHPYGPFYLYLNKNYQKQLINTSD